MKSMLKKLTAACLFLGVLAVLDAYLLGTLFASLDSIKHPEVNWREEWLKSPVNAIVNIFNPSSTAAVRVREGWLKLQPIVILGLVLMVYSSWGKRGVRPASDYGSHGSSRFASDREIKAWYINKGPGMILGQYKGKILIHSNSSMLNQHYAVFGGSGIGKSRSFTIPNLLNADAQGEPVSFVITDPKGEIYDKTAEYMKSLGYKIRVLNLIDIRASERYNPLKLCRSTQDVQTLSKNIIHNSKSPTAMGGDPFWEQAEENFITSLVLYLLHERPPEEHHLASILELGTVGARDQEKLDELFDSLNKSHPARKAYNIFRLAEDKVRAGILIGFAVRLQLWIDEGVAAFSCISDFELSDVANEKTALYVLVSDSVRTFDMISALFFTQLFQELYTVAGDSGGRLRIRVKFILDEFANIGYIPDFEKKMSTMRSRGMEVAMILQSLGQLQNRYPKTWSEILGNCDTTLFLSTNDLTTAEYFSRWLGSTTIMIDGYSQTKKDCVHVASAGQSSQYISRQLLTPDELLKFPREDSIAFQSGRYPIRLQKLDYTKHPNAGKLVDSDYTKFKPGMVGRLVLTDVEALLGLNNDNQKKQEPLNADDLFADLSSKRVKEEASKEPAIQSENEKETALPTETVEGKALEEDKTIQPIIVQKEIELPVQAVVIEDSQSEETLVTEPQNRAKRLFDDF